MYFFPTKKEVYNKLPEIEGEEIVKYEWRNAQESIRKGIDIVVKQLDKWFLAIEDGSTRNRVPDINGRRYDKEYVDTFIKTIDDYIEKEIESSKAYHEGTGIHTRGKPINLPADFNRLAGAAREAFVQDINNVMQEVGYID